MPSNRPSRPGSTGPGGWGDYRGLAGDSALSYSQVEPSVLRSALAVVCATGDALMFSITSDGGAFCVATYHAGKRDVRYFTDVGSLQEALEYLSRVT